MKVINGEIYYKPREVAQLGLITKIGRAKTKHGVYLQLLKLLEQGKIEGYVPEGKQWPLISQSAITKYQYSQEK